MENERAIASILAQWQQGVSPTGSTWEALIQQELADPLRAQGYGISPETVESQLKARSQALAVILPHLEQFPFWGDKILELLWQLWLPLAIKLIASHQELGRPWMQGILGGQGTGKTTLGRILTWILTHLGYSTLALSIDDLYKTYSQRQQLREEDPRLIWRGPPGTHDVALGINLLDRLRNPDGQTIAVPRFDKSLWEGQGDRIEPLLVQTVDILLLEGWFVGVRPVDPAVFETPLWPIMTEADRSFARDMNERLRDYLPLWDRLDGLMVLYPQDYRLSLQWRMQAEWEMKALGKAGMSDGEIGEFVEYFWKALHPELFVRPLLGPGSEVDLVIEMGGDRRIITVYSPRQTGGNSGIS
ncbi:putative kinase [Oscillatoria acuminata]|uniref:Putative kinase n=1 Tax=Oscillatoria acuminata PCC 6304 TaxID=56110 RepID=K9TGI7_9CYAN|nr:putative kinase [Oscillatoria acuminata]AFY81139.1 putative kinase [Oscillatoria acuminata PCC 6304]